MESAEKQLEEDGTKLNEALTGMSTGLARMQQLAQEVGAYKTTVETQLETAKQHWTRSIGQHWIRRYAQTARQKPMRQSKLPCRRHWKIMG